MLIATITATTEDLTAASREARHLLDAAGAGFLCPESVEWVTRDTYRVTRNTADGPMSVDVIDRFPGAPKRAARY